MTGENIIKFINDFNLIWKPQCNENRFLVVNSRQIRKRNNNHRQNQKIYESPSFYSRAHKNKTPKMVQSRIDNPENNNTKRNSNVSTTRTKEKRREILRNIFGEIEMNKDWKREENCGKNIATHKTKLLSSENSLKNKTSEKTK